MLEALDLTARRGDATLFTNLSLRVPPGQALLVTGANGTGKTTLLRILAGLTMPFAGVIRWCNETVAPLSERIRQDAIFVGHLPALKDELSAAENLQSLVQLAGGDASAADVHSALAAVALERQRALPARVLSQGQRRRLGLARLSLLRRPLWFLDEPATALDAAGIAVLITAMAQHLATGGVIVAATHQPLELPVATTRSLGLS